MLGLTYPHPAPDQGDLHLDTSLPVTPGIATMTGLEPATSAVTGRRSTLLSYTAIMVRSFTGV